MRCLEPQRDHRRPASWILASGSPRRAELLRAAGQRFEAEPSHVDEARRSGEGALRFAARVAVEKAHEVAARHPGRWVLGADTVVIVDGEALGKPRDGAEAIAMLARLSGRAHEVATAFVLLDPRGATLAQRVVRSKVVFRRLGVQEIAAYVATGEPLDKAGAYAIQGGAAAFVVSLQGSRSNVIGLPMDEVEEALRQAGLWTAETAHHR
jgi:septum formation protein